MCKHIAFCINNDYSRYVGVAVRSIYENNRGENFIIHILTDYLSEESFHFIQSQCRTISVKIHKIEDSKLRKLKNTWSKYAWFRIMLPELLPDVDRILYLDADVLITDSILELFELDMDGKSVAGVIDIQAFNNEAKERLGQKIACRYICSGVLMMNLTYWRTNNLTYKICNWAIKNDKIIVFPDQDAINAVCVNTKMVLPMKFGVLDVHFHYVWRYSEDMRQQALEALDNPVIVHYAGQAPWIYERMYHQFQHLWDEYNAMLEQPIQKIHYKERNKSVRHIIRNFLDKLHIMRLPRWYVTENLTDEELRDRIKYGKLISL